MAVESEPFSPDLPSVHGCECLGVHADQAGLSALSPVLADDSELIYRFPAPALSTTLILLLLCAPLTFVALASLIPVWRGGSWPVWRRVRHSLAALVLTVLLLTLNDWNLVGFKYF